jgi:hypothetical protein
MSDINWCSVDAAFRKGGLVAGLKELNRQGYVVVPKVPTQAMVDAYWAGHDRGRQYEDMLAAAPKVTK